MTVDELKKSKAELEAEIARLMLEFSKQANVRIDDISITAVEVHGTTVPHAYFVSIGVTI